MMNSAYKFTQRLTGGSGELRPPIMAPSSPCKDVGGAYKRVKLVGPPD